VSPTGHRLTAVLRTVRAPEWWAPKLSPLLAIAYLQIHVQQIPPATAYLTLAALLAALTSLAAYGHAINDLFDIPSDQAAGKANGMAPLSPGRRRLVLLILAVGGVLPWLMVVPPAGARWAWLGIYALLTAYSAPPLRTKERGFSGVLTDAAMAHAVPTFFVCLLFGGLAESPALQTAGVTAAAVASASAAGLRNILLGQLWDHGNDLRSRTRTFTVDVGPDRARRLGRLFFLGELVALAALLVAVSPSLPWLGLVVAPVLALELLKVRVFSRAIFDPLPAQGSKSVPLHDLYQVWLPVTLSLALTLHDGRFGLLTVLHLALFQADIRRRVWSPAVRLLRLGRRGGGPV
jgi:1,4-dihydroxy-2-naphthoate octaprenyltransferase